MGAPKGTRKAIRIVGARTHNLKNISLEIPLGSLTVVTGVSGSSTGVTSSAHSLSSASGFSMNVQPSGTAGWQQVRFTFVAGGNTSRFQADNFWVDPRMSR